jgi:hypothetical protein
MGHSEGWVVVVATIAMFAAVSGAWMATVAAAF